MAYKGQPVPTTEHQIARSKISDGKSVEVTVPENTEIVAHKFYELDGFFGSSFQNVKTGAGETGKAILNIEQAEYEADDIVTTEEFNAGDSLYFKDGKFTITETSARLVGRVTQGKDPNNAIWFILGPQV